MKFFKVCPFCHRFVWFWQSKCYLDAKSKKPCHAYCWLWNMIRETRGQTILPRNLYSHEQFMSFYKEGDWKLYHREKEVEKVEDDTWRKGKGIEK